jgi:dTMP kinase
MNLSVVVTMNGKLIAVEGIDGSGKTTIAQHVYRSLANHGYPCILLKEPSESIYSRIIEIIARLKVPDPELELMLFLKDREVDVRKRILPALRKGLIVIMDRYYYSNIAYQSVRGLNADRIRKLNEKIAPKPDLVILLDLDASKALERIKNRKKLSVFEEKDFLERVRQKFREIADERTVIVDAGRELDVVKREVEQIVLFFVKKTFGDVREQKNRMVRTCRRMKPQESSLVHLKSA